MSGLRVTLTLPGAGSRTFDLAVGKSATVGSAPPANVVFESRDPEIAPVHVRLSVTDRGLEVFQEAPGGFAVNGRKAKRAALRDGDALQVGASTMKVTIAIVPPAGAAGAPPPSVAGAAAAGGTGHGGGVGTGTPSHGTQGISVHGHGHAHGHGPAHAGPPPGHQPRSGEKPVVVLDARSPVATPGGPAPLVATAQAALAGAQGAGLAAQALAGATGQVPPPGAPAAGAPPAPVVGAASGRGFVVVDALAPPTPEDKEREREKSKHSQETRRAAELMFGTPMRGSALAQQVAIEKPDAGLSFHVAPLGGEDKTPVVGDQSRGASKPAATGSQKVALPGGGSPYAMDQLGGGDGGTSRRVLRGAAALQAIPGVSAALGGPVPERGGHSHRALPPRVEPSAADGGAHVIGGASTGEDLLHLLLFIETRAKSGTLLVRAQATGASPPLEGRLVYRGGAIVSRYGASIDDMQYSWLVTIATLPLVEFRFVFSTPPRAPEGEVPTKVSDLIGQVIQRLSSR